MFFIILPHSLNFYLQTAMLHSLLLEYNYYLYFNYIWIKPVLCSHIVISPPLFLIPKTQMLIILSQCPLKWKCSDIQSQVQKQEMQFNA